MLTKSHRKQYMAALGYSYTKEGIKKMQKKYLRSKDVDGVYGKNTDILLKNLYNFKLSGIVTHFKMTEFKCGCGGKYCTGYPSVIHQSQLKMMEAIRTHYGKSITITCGLRCKKYNKSLGGSVINSKHLTGHATDYYMGGITDTINNRKNAIRWIKKQKNHNYTYGNGCNSYGNYINAPYMGNALHTDTNDSVKDVYKDIKSTKTETKKTETDKLTPQEQMVKNTISWAEKIAKDNTYKYKKWTKNENSHKCPICHPGTGKGWNCIGFVGAALHHGGGLKGFTCSNSGLLNDDWASYDKMSLSRWKRRNGKHWSKMIKMSKRIPTSELKPGDVLICYKGQKYKHTALYIGNGYIIDATSSRGITKRKYSDLGVVPKIAVRPKAEV